MTMRGHHHSAMGLVLTGLLAACAKPSPGRVEAAAQAKAVEITEPAAPAEGVHGSRKLLNLDAPIYVDGKQMGVLRYGDLAIAPETMLEGGTPAFALRDVLSSIGVAPSSIKAVHLHGNTDRIASIEGKELLAEPKRFTFTFTSQTTGAAIQQWDTGGLKNAFVVHEIRKVSVFVKRTPTAIHPQRRCHLDKAGACTTDVPYLAGPELHGTRVYVDGRIVGFAKRRSLTDAMVLGTEADGEQNYAVEKLVASFGVDARRIKAVELVAGDDVIGRASTDQWTAVAPSLAFSLPRHNRGKVVVHVPAALRAFGTEAAPRDALVTSIFVYTKAPTVMRPLSPISEQTDLSVRLASNDDEGARDPLGSGEP